MQSVAENQSRLNQERSSKNKAESPDLVSRDGGSGGELRGWQFWLLNMMAFFGLAMVVTTIILTLGNQEMKTEISQRQRIINDGIRLSRLNTQLIQTLAETSAKTGDAALRNLLLSQGIDFTVKKAQLLYSSTENGGRRKP